MAVVNGPAAVGQSLRIVVAAVGVVCHDEDTNGGVSIVQHIIGDQTPALVPEKQNIIIHFHLRVKVSITYACIAVWFGPFADTR